MPVAARVRSVYQPTLIKEPIVKKPTSKKPRIINVKTGTIWLAVKGDKQRHGYMIMLTGADAKEVKRLQSAAKTGKLEVDRLDLRR